MPRCDIYRVKKLKISPFHRYFCFLRFDDNLLKSLQTKNAEIVMKLLVGCIACMQKFFNYSFFCFLVWRKDGISTTNHNTIFLVSELSSSSKKKMKWEKVAQKYKKQIPNSEHTFFTAAAALALLIPFKQTFAPSYSWCYIYFVLLNSDIWWWWWYFQWYQTEECLVRPNWNFL